MGKTKSKSIRKAVKTMRKEGVDFNKNFVQNKRLLEGLVLSKKIRNQMAGLIARTKKQDIAAQEKLAR
jgi:ribosomal protein S17E